MLVVVVRVEHIMHSDHSPVVVAVAVGSRVCIAVQHHFSSPPVVPVVVAPENPRLVAVVVPVVEAPETVAQEAPQETVKVVAVEHRRLVDLKVPIRQDQVMVVRLARF